MPDCPGGRGFAAVEGRPTVGVGAARRSKMAPSGYCLRPTLALSKEIWAILSMTTRFRAIGRSQERTPIAPVWPPAAFRNTSNTRRAASPSSRLQAGSAPSDPVPSLCHISVLPAGATKRAMSMCDPTRIRVGVSRGPTSEKKNSIRRGAATSRSRATRRNCSARSHRQHREERSCRYACRRRRDRRDAGSARQTCPEAQRP
jgi:hypothetical protein